MMMREPVTRTRTKVYHHDFETTLNHVQLFEVTAKMKAECTIFTTNQIQKVLKDFKNDEMLQKSVENRLAEKHLLFLHIDKNSNEYDKIKRYQMDVELKMHKRLADVLNNLTKVMFERKIESQLTDVLDCHLKSIGEKREVICTRYDSSSSTLRLSNWNLLEFIELSILHFVLKRKLDRLKQKAEEETKAFIQTIEKGNQQRQESRPLLSKPQNDVVVDVPSNKEQIIVSYFILRVIDFDQIVIVLQVQTKPSLQNPNDCVLTSTTKVVFRDKKEKARSEMAVPIPTQVASVSNKPIEPIPDKLFIKVKEPARNRTKDFCHAFCFVVGVLIVLAGIGVGLFFLVTFKWWIILIKRDCFLQVIVSNYSNCWSGVLIM